MAQYLLKYIDSSGERTVALPTDVFEFGGIIINGIFFDETTIASPSGLAVVSGDLQAQIDAITSDTADEGHFVATAGQTDFSVSGYGFTFDALDSIPDIVVYVNGNRKRPNLGQIAPANYDYRKLNDNTIRFAYGLQDGDYVYIRNERTGGSGGGGGGSGDLTNITVDIQPQFSAQKSIGTITKPWKGVFLRDKITSQVWELEVVNGVFQVTAVP